MTIKTQVIGDSFDTETGIVTLSVIHDTYASFVKSVYKVADIHLTKVLAKYRLPYVQPVRTVEHMPKPVDYDYSQGVVTLVHYQF